MKVIEEIKISYFRSFSQETRIFNLNDLNIISGKNDSGKSNILKALNLFFTEEKVDFYNEVNFEKDFAKSRADQSKEKKIKKKIQISILFNRIKFSGGVLPNTFWVEKEWDKDGILINRKTKDYSGHLIYHNSSTTKVEASTTSFLKKIHFLYIPAIKDNSFFDYLKKEYQQSLGVKMSKLTQVDKKQKLTLKEWMEQLSAGDITDLLGQKIDSEADGMMKHFVTNTRELSESNFNIPELDFSKVLEVVTENEIPLTSRGDGIQAKFIPQILNEITRNKSADIVIWGFEEPENSYEYANAQLLADKFKNEYSIDKQIFVTSHAFNFISLKGDNISLFRAWKENFEEGTKIKYIANQEKLFDSDDSIRLKEELGIIQLNQELEEFFKNREKEREVELESYRCKSEELNTQITNLTKPLIITEGKTDWKHLKKAHIVLGIGLDIEFWEYINDMGYTSLDKMIEEYQKISHSKKIIFIFDSDQNLMNEKYGREKFNIHGNNIYSFCIPKISDELEKISIEFYYQDNELKTYDKENRRLFVGNEFFKSGNSLSGEYQTQIKNKCETLTIIDEKVFLKEDLANLHSKALSKNTFAENILNETNGFENFNFENFNLIFNVINDILKD